MPWAFNGSGTTCCHGLARHFCLNHVQMLTRRALEQHRTTRGENAVDCPPRGLLTVRCATGSSSAVQKSANDGGQAARKIERLDAWPECNIHRSLGPSVEERRSCCVASSGNPVAIASPYRGASSGKPRHGLWPSCSTRMQWEPKSRSGGTKHRP